MARVGKGYLKKLNDSDRGGSASRAYTQQIVAQHLSGVQVHKKNPGGTMNLMINETQMSMSHGFFHTSSQSVIDKDTYLFGLGVYVIKTLGNNGQICKIGISASHASVATDRIMRTAPIGHVDPVFFLSGTESGVTSNLANSGSGEIYFIRQGMPVAMGVAGQTTHNSGTFTNGFSASYFVTAVTHKDISAIGSLRIAAYYAKLSAPTS